MYTKPILYTKVVDATGKTLLNNTTPKQTKVFSPQAAYILYDMLKGPVNEYNATGAKWGNMPISGKTGTTTNSTDLWFAGLSPYLSGSVWIGYDKPDKLIGSSSGCATLWGKLMAKAHEGLEVKDIEAPSNGIVKVNVCKDSGLLPSALCSADPRGSRVIDEMFIEGTEPTETCSTHVTGNINRFTNKLTDNSSIFTQSRVYIKKDHPNSATADYPYVLTSSSNDVATQEPPVAENNAQTPPANTPSNPPPVTNPNENGGNVNVAAGNNKKNNKHVSINTGDNNTNSPLMPDTTN
jgi:penicillin-binding protein 1A